MQLLHTSIIRDETLSQCLVPGQGTLKINSMPKKVKLVYYEKCPKNSRLVFFRKELSLITFVHNTTQLQNVINTISCSSGEY